LTKTYTANQGDTWDKIAFDTLGSEYLLPLLMDANKHYRKTFIFSGGELLIIPEIDTSELTERPDWLGEDEEL
jgi:hypothetical protein